MFLGLLIGLTIFGVILTMSNGDRKYDHPDQRLKRSYVRMVGILCFCLGICGAVGWIVEVLFFSR